MIAQKMVDLEETPEDQPQPAGSSRLVLWLIAFSLGILFVPLYLISSTIQENTVLLQDQVATLEAQVEVTAVPDATEEALRAELMTLNEQVSALESIKTELEVNYTDWPGIMSVIASYDPAFIRLTEVQQADNFITLNGAANDENIVTSYADNLRNSSYFESVAVQSLNLQILPTATPAPTVPSLPNANAPLPLPTAQVISRELGFTILITLKANSNAESTTQPAS